LRSIPRYFWPVAAPAIAILLLFALLSPFEGGSAGAVEPSAPEPELVAPQQPTYRFDHSSLGRGGTLDSALERLGFGPGERAAQVEAAAEHLDLRRLSPRTGITITRDGLGRLVTIGIRAEQERFLRLGFDSGGEWVELPVETTVETTAGVVESSLAQAFSGAEHGLQITLAFADIFQWDVDLLVDPRPGDRVQVVYQVKKLGELPEDLPPFGETIGKPGDFLALGRILAAAYQGEMAKSAALWVADDAGGGDYYDTRGRPLRKSFLKSPLNYRRISSGFSNARRNPVTKRVVPHHGVDYAAAPGTPVSSTADGRVISAGWDGALGRAIKIRHGSEYTTIYGHLRSIAKGIRIGAEVRQNQVIGYVGSTGRATGPHLHYTILHRGSAINPLRFKSPSAEPLPDELKPRLEIAKRRWLPVLDAIPPEERKINLARGNETSRAGREGA
jgi:murein DD-endopeptidase MepM/ murein hydrolase activator NlpD